MDETYIKISETELKNLLWANEMLAALENGGVDNWGFYSDAISEYLAAAYNTSVEEIKERELTIKDLVEKEIKTYEKIS
jgi:hypothetical protein